MQDKRGSRGPSRKAAGKDTIDNDARWDRIAELIEALRDAGYDCELSVGQNLH